MRLQRRFAASSEREVLVEKGDVVTGSSTSFDYLSAGYLAIGLKLQGDILPGHDDDLSPDRSVVR
jgi:hypothetical protein